MSDDTPNPTEIFPAAPPPAATNETVTAVGIGSAAPIDGAVTLDAGDPAGRTPPPDIPGYQVECELGRGGMGVVYKARHLRLNRPVAIKMILGGRYADPAAHFRFLAEAEAIAQLQHPGVVQVYEVGQHDGLPFFALEYVAGGTLAEKLARDGRFAPRAAAELLATLADAVAAAHARGIVHRDLKPGNILLANDQKPPAAAGLRSLDIGHSSFRPKVADFGLAKVGQSDLTGSRAIMGTPSYMSPEQAAGKTREVGTPADVWALGAILYECMTGRPPFRGESAMDTVQQVMTRDPERPRTAVRDVPRDLETICLKCLEKDQKRRYPTAAALGDDLRAFLAGRPIAARPVGLAERGWKWAKRRPGAATVAAGAALAVVAFVAVVAGFNVRLHEQRDAAVKDRDAAQTAREQADAAREQALTNFRLARRAVDVYTKKIVEDPRLRGFGLDDVRKEWLQIGSEFYREFARQYADDPTIEPERARAYTQLAEITATVGAPAEALALYAQAREIQERLVAAEPGEAEHRFDLSTTVFGEAGTLRQADRKADARARYDRAIALRADLVRDFPAEVRFAGAHAAGWNNLGLLHKDEGQVEKAEEAFRTAARLMAAVPPGPIGPDGEDAALLHAMVYTNLGDLYVNARRFADAEEVLRKAVELQTRGPDSRDARATLGLTRFSLGHLHLKTARPDAAEKEFRAALDLLDPLTAKYPGVLDYQNVSAAGRMALGMLYLQTDRLDECEKVFRKAVDGLEPLTRLDPGRRQFRTNLLSGYTVLGQLYGTSGRTDEAEAVLRPALDTARGLLKEDARNPDFRDKEAVVLHLLGKTCQATNRRPEAEGLFRHELAAREALARDHPSAEHAAKFGGSLCDLGLFLAGTKPDEARKLYDRAEATLRAVPGGQPGGENAGPFLRNTLTHRAALHERQNRVPEATADRERVVVLSEAAVKAEPTAENRATLADALDRLARTHRTAGNRPAAAAAFERARSHYQALTTAEPNELGYRVSAAEMSALLGLLLADADRGRAEAAYRSSVAVYDEVLAREPARPEARVDLGGVCCNLGNLLSKGTKPEDGLEWYGRAVTALRRVLDDGAGSAQIRRRARTYLRNTHGGRAGLLEHLERATEAAADQAEIVAYWARQTAGQADEADPQAGLAAALERLGDLHRQARQAGPAADAFGRSAAALTPIVARDPKAAGPRLRLAGVLEKHGKVFGADGDFVRALPFFEKAVGVREELARDFPTRTDNADVLRELSVLMARGYIVTKAPEKGEAILARVADVRRELATARPTDPAHQLGLADALQTLGLSYALRAQHAKAEPVFREAADAWDRFAKLVPADVPEHREAIADCFGGLGQARLHLAKLAAAAAAFDRAVEVREAMAADAVARKGGEKPAPAVARGGCLANLGLCLQAADPARSLDPYARAISVLRKVASDDPANATAKQYLRNAVSGRATALGKLNRYKDALADWDLLLESDPADRKAETRTSRSLVLARLGEHARAAAEAEELAGAAADGGRLYNLACTLSLCSSAAGVDRAKSEDYSARAVTLLRRAAAAGYFRTDGRVEHMKTDSDMDPVRRRDDFRGFVADLIAAPAVSPTEFGPAPRSVEK